MIQLYRSAWIVLKKDLLIEYRSKVLTTQILPLSLTVLLIFGFALGPSDSLLLKSAPGLIWITIVLCSLLAVGRAISIESNLGQDGLKIFGLDPVGVFIGKVAAICIELFSLAILISFGAVILFNSNFRDIIDVLSMVLGAILAIVALASAGVLFGFMASASSIRETLLPLLYLPVAAPVVLAATKLTAPALGGAGASNLEWLGVLTALSISYLCVGAISLEPLLEES